MISPSIVLVLMLAPGQSASTRLLAPATRHAQIEAQCSSLRGEEALRCHNEADAQFDILDAEQFIADGEVSDALSRVDQACAKYEDLLNAMIADVESTPITDTMLRYVSAITSIFSLLAREGRIEDLTQAVLRLHRGRQFVVDLRQRRDDLAQQADLDVATDDLTNRLALALDQLARQEMHHAQGRYRAVRGGDGDGGALSYYKEAATHAASAYALSSTFAYKIVELDAELAQAELKTVMARRARGATESACASYNQLRHELDDIERSAPRTWKTYPQLRDFQQRSQRGSRACAARPRLVAGGVLVGVGAIGVALALGLYAQYNSTCQFSPGDHACRGIPVETAEGDRYTRQVQASIGLAVIGGALLSAGATVLIHGIVQRKQAQPKRFAFVPAVGPHQVGAALRLRF